MGRRGVGVSVLLLGALTTAPRRAEACHTGVEIAVALVGLADVAVYAPLTIADVAWRKPPRWYGAIEVSLAAPGVLISASLARETLRECEEGSTLYPQATRNQQIFTFSMLGWGTLVLAHGVYTIARPRAAPLPVAVLPIASDTGELVGLGIGGQF